MNFIERGFGQPSGWRQTGTGGRLDYLDSVKGLAILLVVLGHMDQQTGFLTNWIYSFHVPLFFMVSGFLFSYNRKWMEQSPWRTIGKRAVRLLYPYAVFCTLEIGGAILKRLLFHRGNFRSFRELVVDCLSFQGYQTLWFLPALFFAEVLFIFLCRRKRNGFIFAALLFLVIWFEDVLNSRKGDSFPRQMGYVAERAVIAMLFVWMGFAFCTALRRWEGNWKRWVTVLVCGLLLGAEMILCQWNGHVDLYTAAIHNPILYFLCGSVGSFSVFLLIKNLCGKSRLLQYYGRNALIVMITSVMVPADYLSRYLISHSDAVWQPYLIRTAATALILVLEVPVIEIINRFLPFLMTWNGKKTRRR